jgi:hypothetical protein
MVGGTAYQEMALQFINPDKRFTVEWLVGVVTADFEWA